MTAGAAHRGVAIAKDGAVGVFEARGAEGGYERTTSGGDELVSGASRSMDSVVEEGQAAGEAGPKARMDHCAMVEVLYYALCGVPWGSRGELMRFTTMIMVMHGHELFVPLQLKRIDWRQEMFTEE